MFTVEEINLMCMFDTSGRAALINDLNAALSDFYEPEMKEIAESALGKLAFITDAEFPVIELTPEYDFEDDDGSGV